MARLILPATLLLYVVLLLRWSESRSEELIDLTECPDECICSVGTQSDLVVQCFEYQSNTANSLLPRLAKNTENFVTRLDLIESKIPILIDDFLSNQRGYSKLLRSLRIKNSGIKKINPRAFKSAKYLEEIELQENDISTLPSEVFSSTILPNLKLLSLSHNQNLNFPDKGPFLKSHSIEEIDISFCGVTGVYSQTFSRLQRIKYINLQNNNIDFIHSEAFSRLHYLEELDLSNNKIIDIPSKLPATLQTLRLRNNPEFDVNSLINLSQNIAISELDLSQCNIKTLPRETFARIYDLNNLNLSHNSLTDLYFPFVLRQLRYFDLSFNKLSGKINDNLFGSCDALETLKLGWNHGLELPENGFQGNLKSLYNLDLSGCELASISPSSIGGFTGLAHLNLSHNQLELTEDLFKPFLDLSSLDLSHNEIEEIPETIFRENIKLKKLSLASNENLAIQNPILNSKILENNLLLKSLDIGHCDFEDVPEFLPPNLETLIVEHNKIRDPTHLTKLIEKSLLNLRTIGITQNLWKCNFDFKQMVGILRERQIMDDGKNGTWSDYVADVCLTEKLWDEIVQATITRPREIIRSHFWSVLTFSLTLMAFVLIAGIASVACKRRMSPTARRKYKQLNDSSNLPTPASTPAVPNKIYRDTCEPIGKSTTFTKNLLFPRFPVTQSEIPDASYLSGNYHHKELNP